MEFRAFTRIILSPPGEGHGIQTVVATHSVSDEWIQHILTVEVK